MRNTDLSQLVGKTIHAVEWFPVDTQRHYDDGDYLVITFSDGFKLRLAGDYDSYTGKSIQEYPTSLTVDVQEPEGFNGPGTYEVLLKEKQHYSQCDWSKGCHGGYNMTYKGQNVQVENETVHFEALSKQEAEKAVDMSEINYLKFIRPLSEEAKKALENTKYYNE